VCAIVGVGRRTFFSYLSVHRKAADAGHQMVQEGLHRDTCME